MTKELREYLRKEWKRRNLPKYQKYFDEWVINLTEVQIQFWKTQSFK